ncbi:hypothetical protein AVEN_182486-1 [Araneus ventricosus]|uniref:Helitron helicase-like domain-containing protein n=1 Tax=Araneus ventricosus TaxID=182803 RepID=A0A4Y2IGR2_ARAVE|nr:hypothetical protein AVEN_182486-1 [Araneus ventricosus]
MALVCTGCHEICTIVRGPRHNYQIHVRAFIAWSEIKEELARGQSPADRHDLIARVFRQKLIKLIHIITKSCIYGDVNCWMYSIEWQKRDFPRAHILIRLKEKIRRADVHNFIRAEIPDIQKGPVLFEIASKHMIYGPCGALNMKYPCMKDKKCPKRYRREMICETQTAEDGYPLYRRRNPNKEAV